MFKGWNKELQKKLEQSNQTSDYFIFSFADLELCERDGERRKCRLLSEELSNKLHQIYSEGKSGYIPPIKFIDFELDKKKDSIFFKIDEYYASNYRYWLRLEKKALWENSKVSSDGNIGG